MKKLVLLFIIVIPAFIGGKAQGNLKDAKAQIKAHSSYDTLIYYGVDLSHVRVNDAPKASRSVKYSEVYPPAWIAFIEKELSPDRYVNRVLDFPVFIYNFIIC